MASRPQHAPVTILSCFSGIGGLDAWRCILATHPWMAPAVPQDPSFIRFVRRVAPGIAGRLDAAMMYRADRLRAIGNSVVKSQATAAFLLLWDELHPPRAQ